VRGKPRDFTVSGTVAVHDSKLVNRLPLFDLRRSGGAAASTGIHLPGVTLPAPWRGRLDVGIATSEPFAVETNLLTGKLDAQLRLRGDLAQPSLLGTIASDDATVILPGARLRASALLLEFRADAPTLPRLTASARGRRHGFDILVNAQGRYDRPDIVFSSEPPLPSDELLVLVTTGARPSGLRDVRGVGAVLGTYVAQEFADWIFGSESTEAKDSFLDRFTVETGTEMSRGGSESIVVEFRIGERVYLQGERDVYSDINMGLVYRLRFR
jgi:translocation and assembly module TamB